MRRRSTLMILVTSAALALTVACGDTTPNPSAASPMPEFLAYDCSGSPVDVKAWAAQFDVTFITWGAGWCQACAKEVPEINEHIFTHFEGQSVGVAQILVENGIEEKPPQALCEAWVTDYEAEFPVLVDLDWDAVDAVFGGSVGGQLPLQTIIVDDEIVVRSYDVKIVSGSPSVQSYIEAFLQ